MTAKNFVEVLLVEDSKHDAELALLALEEANLANNIVWLKNGEEALNFLFAREEYSGKNAFNAPKLILLDLKMPKVGGIEVLRQVRASPKLKYVPVTVLTSSKEEKDIIDTYELGVNSYIVKPVDFEQFSKSVKEIGYYWVLLNQKPAS